MIAQKAHHAVLVASHAAQNNDVFFLALEAIHTAKVDVHCGRASILRHKEGAQKIDLRFVHADEADASTQARLRTRTQRLVYLHRRVRFALILDRVAATRLFQRIDVEEAKWAKELCVVPWLECFGRHLWSIDELAAIEGRRRKEANVGMHAVLDR